MAQTIKLFKIISTGNIQRVNNILLCRYSKGSIGRSTSLVDSISDISRTGGIPTAPPPDYLLQNLKNATSSQNILDIVGAHYKIMNSKQLLQALRSLFTLQKFGNTNISTQQIIKHPDFAKLCYCLKSQAGLIELNETLEALKVISFVGVSSNSTIVQVLLQLLRHNINDLSIQHIIFLDFLLRQFKGSPLVDGLLIALPVVFEANLPVKMDRENITQLTECLHYASKKNVSTKCIELIVNSLSKRIDFHGELDAKTAYSILWSICDMEPNEFFVPLFKKAMNGLLVEGFEKLSYKDVLTTLSKISSRVNQRFLQYYDDTFYDYCAQYIIDNDLGFEEATYTLLRFTKIGHTNDSLLKYILQKCEENVLILIKAPPLHAFALVVGLAQSDYKSSNWQHVQDIIESITHFDKSNLIWIKLAASLSALNIYKPYVLQKALDISYLKHILVHGRSTDYTNFLLVYQAITTFKPEYKHLLPDTSLIQSLALKAKPILEYPLEGALQKALGGENYVNTCMRTKNHHHIDHVIIMRKGGFPVPLKKQYQHIEDINVPPEGFMILVLVFDNSHYTINTNRLKGTSLLTIKTLEADGYNVVPICLEVWKSLPDFERIPFIMQAIRLKVETKIEMENVVC